MDAVSIIKEHVFLDFSQKVFSFPTGESHRILADIKNKEIYFNAAWYCRLTADQNVLKVSRSL